MKHLWQCGIAIVMCLILTGCAGRNVQPPRETITFDYVPATEAPPGSADVTFAVVGTKFVASAVQQSASPQQPALSLQQALGIQQGVPLSAIPTPSLFEQLISNMTKDFGEVLTARGYTVSGTYRTLDDMIYPDKEGSDLILTAEVRFSVDTSGLRYNTQTGKTILVGCVLSPLAIIALIGSIQTPQESDQWQLLVIGAGLTVGAVMLGMRALDLVPSGQVQVGCEVELQAYEGPDGRTYVVENPPYSVVYSNSHSETAQRYRVRYMAKTDGNG